MKKLFVAIVVGVAAYFALVHMGVITYEQADRSQPAAAPATAPEANQQQAVQSPPAQPKAPAKSTTDSVIEYGTGYTQVKAGQHSKDKINKITSEHNKKVGR